jgi:RNA polymerase sigma-70 factor (ECF subfamily)
VKEKAMPKRSSAEPAAAKPATRSDRWTALLVAARDGREEAFSELLAEARPAIWKRARQRLQDDALADEVASRTFVKAWRNIAGYDAGRSNAGTWLYKIAERLVIDALKKRRQQQAREVMGFESLGQTGGEEGEGPVRMEPEDDVEMAPPEEADHPLHGRLVRDALAKLSQADQEVLRLCYFEQHSYEEIARRLGVTVPAVGPRLTRARQRLLELLPPEVLP